MCCRLSRPCRCWRRRRSRPERPGKDGYRIWYVDEQDVPFLCEGVSDMDGLAENALPPFRVTRPPAQSEPGVLWRRLGQTDAE